jgi:colanic acid/amylovoran biosynthesis glycosyltransferase
LKIAICSQDYPQHVGGPHVWMSRIIPAMREKGVEFVVLFTIGKKGEEFKNIQSLQNEGIKCHVYDGLDYTEHKLRWIIKTVKIEKPNIFIPDYDIPAYFASRWIRESGIPTIGIIRSDDHLYRSIIKQFVSRPNPYNPNAVVCVSKYLEDLVLSHNNNHIIVRRIPSGTPIPKKISQKNTDTIKLIYTGRIVDEQKRITEVVSLLCKTVQQIPGTEAVIYGSGKRKIVNTVINIIDTEGRNLPIRYGGRLESDEIHEKLLEGHVFVLLSDYEGLPTSLMEAMACGLVPVCTSMRSGIPELITDGETGIIVDNRGEAFLNAIHRLKYEKGLWERLSKGARTKIIDKYSFDISVDKWFNLVQELKEDTHNNDFNMSIPRSNILPEYNPDFKQWDNRWPGYLHHYNVKWKRLISSMSNRILKRSF